MAVVSGFELVLDDDRATGRVFSEDIQREATDWHLALGGLNLDTQLLTQEVDVLQNPRREVIRLAPPNLLGVHLLKATKT